MNPKADDEANVALLGALQGYQQLLAESFRFQVAKAQNNDMLPMHMWSDWNKWRKKIKEVDSRLEKYYK